MKLKFSNVPILSNVFSIIIRPVHLLISMLALQSSTVSSLEDSAFCRELSVNQNLRGNQDIGSVFSFSDNRFGVTWLTDNRFGAGGNLESDIAATFFDEEGNHLNDLTIRPYDESLSNTLFKPVTAAVSSTQSVFSLWCDTSSTSSNDLRISTIPSPFYNSTDNNFRLVQRCGFGSRSPSFILSLPTSNQLFVTWRTSSTFSLSGLFLRNDLTFATPIFTIIPSLSSSINVATSLDAAELSNGNIVITWLDESSNDGDIFGQLISNQGLLLGGSFRVNTYTPLGQYDPHVASLPNGGFVIAWSSQDQLLSFNVLHSIHFQMYDENAFPQGDERSAVPTDYRISSLPSVVSDGIGRFFITFSSTFTEGSAGDGSAAGVFIREFNATTGDPLGLPQQVNSLTDGPQSFPRSTITPEGNLIITWLTDPEQNFERDIRAKIILRNISSTNRQPQLPFSFQAFQVLPNSPFEFSINPTEINDREVRMGCQELSYTTVDLPSWLSFDNSTVTFSGLPTLLDTRQSSFVLAVDDSIVTAPINFNITINTIPQIVSPYPDFVIQRAFNYQLPESAIIDDDNDIIRYEAAQVRFAGNGIEIVDLPEWLSFNSNNRMFSGTPPAETYGSSIRIRISAFDDFSPNQTVNSSFSFFILASDSSTFDTNQPTRINTETGVNNDSSDSNDNNLIPILTTVGAVSGACLMSAACCFFVYRATKTKKAVIEKAPQEQRQVYDLINKDF